MPLSALCKREGKWRKRNGREEKRKDGRE